jgi:N-acetyl-alpha-D-glucosaminyl L-malate synthase BshA
MHASNFRPVKRVGDVVRIFAQVRARIPAKLLLVGDGPDRPFVQQLVHEMNLGPDVHFLGEQDQLEPLFLCADLFLLPSEQESFGLTALEAMNCGVPVIATAIGGLPEVIALGETGYLLPVGDIAGMAAKAVEILSDPTAYELFKARARRRAEQFFDAAHIIPQYEAFYREVLSS